MLVDLYTSLVAVFICQKKLKKLHGGLDRLVALITSGKAPDRILTEISDRENRIKALQQELAELQVQVPAEIDRKWLRKATSERLSRFFDLIHADLCAGGT